MRKWRMEVWENEEGQFGRKKNGGQIVNTEVWEQKDHTEMRMAFGKKRSHYAQ